MRPRDQWNQGRMWVAGLTLLGLAWGWPGLAARAQEPADAGPARVVELAQLQVENRRAQVEEAQARQALALKSLNRVRQLAARGEAVDAEVDAAVTEVATTAAALRSKQAELREAEIRLEQVRERPKDEAKPQADNAERLRAQLKLAEEMLVNARRLTRKPDNDPVVVQSQRRIEALRAQLQELEARDADKPAAARPAVPAASDRRLDDLEKKLDRVLRELDDQRRDRRSRDPRREEEPIEDEIGGTDWVELARKLTSSYLDKKELPTRDLVHALYEQALGRKPTRDEARRAVELVDRAREGEIATGDVVNALSQTLAGFREFREREQDQHQSEPDAESRLATRSAQKTFLKLQVTVKNLAERRDPAMDVVERVYRVLLDRSPSAEELRRSARDLEAAGDDRERRADVINDLTWSLLNGAEYRAKFRKSARPGDADTEMRLEPER